MSLHRFALLALVALSVAACNNNDPDCIDYVPNCNLVEPTEGTLRIHITRDAQNTRIPIAVYNGYIEDNVLYFRDTISTAEVSYAVPFGRYSASAGYQRGGDQITAIDGDKVRLKSNNDCDYTCYTTVDGDIDLRLK
jgi:hypothetical protein